MSRTPFANRHRMEHIEEDTRALEAALAFLDDWEVMDASCESSSECSSGGCGSPASFASLGVETSPARAGIKFTTNFKSKSTTKSKSKPYRRSTTDRRKEEIRQLRAELKELKEKAGQLYQTNELKKRVRESTINVRGQLALELARRGKLATAWEEVALRQKRLRIASEVENVKLKDDVIERCKTIASIKTELRQLAKNKQNMFELPAELLTKSMKRGTAGDNLALDKLCRQMETAYFAKAKGDLAVVCNGLQLVPGKQIVEMSSTKLVAMVHYTWVLPFDYFQVSSVALDEVDNCCRPMYKLVLNTDTTNDTQIRNYVIEHQIGGFSYGFHANCAVRQRFDAQHAGFVFASMSHPFVINGNSVSGISLSNRGVTSVTRLSGEKNSTALSQIDIAYHIEIDISVNAGEDRKLYARGLAEAIVDSDREQFDNLIGRIESAVIQRQLQAGC